jgi:hypothetical protein
MLLCIQKCQTTRIPLLYYILLCMYILSSHIIMMAEQNFVLPICLKNVIVQYLYIFTFLLSYYPSVCQVAESVLRLATGWTIRGLIPGGGEIFGTCPNDP